MASDVVAAGKVVGFHYTLRNDSGAVVDSSQGGEALSYLHGAGNIVPGLENALTGKKIGDQLKVKVSPSEGYGERFEEGVQQIPRDQFPPGIDIQVGMQFGAEGPDGSPVPVWVIGIAPDTVTIDFNHPMAGQNLNFEVAIASVRDASPEEMQHGHPHGPGGHHH